MINRPLKYSLKKEEKKLDNLEDVVSLRVYLGQNRKQLNHVLLDGEKTVSLQILEERSSAMQILLGSEELETSDLEKFRDMVVFPGDLLAYEAKEDASEHTNPEHTSILEPGPNVRLSSRGEYFARRYGFVCLLNDTLSVLSPIRIDRNRVKADWLIPPKHPVGLEKNMLELWISKENILLDPIENIDQLIDDLNTKTLEPDVYTIVSGTAPLEGTNGRIEWQVNVTKSSGTIDADDHMDFRERNYVVNVSANQPVAKLIPPTNGKTGLDLTGEEIPVSDGVPVKLKAGDNIITEKDDQTVTFISAIDGVLHYNGFQVSVAKILVLPGGVDYETGNIDFSGDVVVLGQVTAGFTVKAAGNVIIHDTVERGCRIIAQGDITVAKGIVGDRTFVKAGGTILAQNVHEATIQAGQDIILENYSLHAKLWSCGFIRVKKGTGQQGGSIMGGEAWASDGIDVYVAGSHAWKETKLTTGILPDTIEELVILDKGIEVKNIQSKQLLDFFGLATINPDKIRDLIKKAEGVRRKSLALRAKYLSKVGKDLKGLLNDKQEVLESIGPPPEHVEIRIRRKAFPNVIIGLGDQHQHLDTEQGKTRFKLSGSIVDNVEKHSLSDILFSKHTTTLLD